MRVRQLTGLDALSLSAETTDNPLHMMAVILLDPTTIPGGYNFSRFQEFFASRLHRVPPLRRRLLEVPFGLARPYWVDDAEIDIGYHIRRAALPRPGTHEQLAQMAAEMNEGMLPRDRPLWQLRVVEGVEMEAGGAGYETPGSEGGSVAVLAKLHHAMMDGVAGMRFMGALLSRAPQAQPIESEPGDTRLLQAPETGVLIGRAVRDLGNRPWRITTAAARTLLQTARRLRTRGELIEVPRTVLNGQAGHERRVAILTVPIGLVRDVARDGDATVNDVVVTIVGGALRKALEATGDLPERPLVAGIPVSTHDDGDALTNAYSPIFTSLHTGEPDALRRLRLVRDSARKAKIDRSRDGGNALDAWADIPIPLETALFSRAYSLLNRTEQLTPLCNCLISNVQGPSVPLHLAGARVAGVYPLGPIIDGVGLNVTVLSREDALDIGIVAGALAPGDLWSFGRSISAELDALAKGLEPRHPPSERRPQWPA